MGFLCWSKVEPDDHQNASVQQSPGAKSTISLMSDNFPASAKNRSCTDVIFIIIMGAFLITLLGLIIYCTANGDVYRIVNGYDNCGNVCGRITEKDESDKRCHGFDFRDRPYLLIREPNTDVNLHRQCVAECPRGEGYKLVLNRCVPPPSKTVDNIFSKTGLTDFLQEASEDIQLTWREIVYMCLLAVFFSVIVLLLFRFVAGLIIWLILGCVSLACTAGTIYLWVRYSQLKEMDDDKNEFENHDTEKRTTTAYLAFAIAATIVTIIILLVILVMRKRIKLVVQLFKEASKAISSMPVLLLEPFLTFFTLGVIVGLWLICTVAIESSGFLAEKDGVENYEYRKDGTMKFTRWYNLFGLLWFCQFAIACQQIVIAGAVSKWFFTRNKDNLGYPTIRSFRTLIRFHLGTAAFGSLIISLVQLFRSVVSAIEGYTKNSENSVTKCIFKTCHCCLYCFEKILQYLSRNAYIITAIHGHSFCKAGQVAFKLLASNALRVAAINSVGDFVLILAKVMIIVSTGLCGLEMLRDNESIHHIWVPIVLGGIFAFFVAHSFISVYEMTIDTIFLCFCEDCEHNDGMSKPYYMSRGLMEFVENSKKALEILDANGKDWSGATTRSMK